MTKEERAEKWFEKIPESESISMEKKMEICHKAAIGIVVIFFVLCIVERILLYSLTDGEVLNRMADILNKMSEGSHTRNHYRGMAVVGGLMVLPFMIIPTLGALMFKKQYIKYQVETMKDNMTRADVTVQIGRWILVERNKTDLQKKSWSNNLHQSKQGRRISSF